MNRRNFLHAVGVATVATSFLSTTSALAADKPKGPNAMGLDKAIAAITGGKALKASSKVHLKAPEIAENGAVVPITVEVDSPMSPTDYVKSIHVLATKNSNVRTVDIMLTPSNGIALFATRIKLGTTQNVLIIAETSKGEFLTAKQSIKVTIGGCG